MQFLVPQKICIMKFVHLEVVKDPKNLRISKGLVSIQNCVSVRSVKLEAAYLKALLYLF